jgi:hypothetical protein
VEQDQVKHIGPWLQERKLMQAVIKQHLFKAQARMKAQADKHRTEVHFRVGDKVFLKLQPYVQSSLGTRANQKLAFKYFGTYIITDKIGSIACRLQLPDNSTMHPVFHVSQLKKCVSNSSQVSNTLPDLAATLYQVPEKILDSRWIQSGGADIAQVLVQWSNLSRELASWEDK